MSDIENYIGNTPLVLIDEIGSNKIFGKLEGNNPVSYTHLTLPTTPYV